MAGLWLKLDARLPDNGVWRDLLDLRAWIWILCRAKRPPPGVPAGTVRVTMATLGRQLAGTICGRHFEPGSRALRTTLRRLVADGRVVVAEWAGGTEAARRAGGSQGFLTVTVCNFAAYQGTAEGVGRGSNGHATARNGSGAHHATYAAAEGVGRPPAEGSAEGVGRGVGRGSNGPREASNGPRDGSDDTRAAEGAAEGRGRRSADQEERREREGERESATASLPRSHRPMTPEDLRCLWNEVAERAGFRSCLGLSGKREAAARARLAEHPERATWERILSRASASAFLTGRVAGRDGRTWKANIDWLLRPGSITKIEEGAYDDATPAQARGPVLVNVDGHSLERA